MRQLLLGLAVAAALGGAAAAQPSSYYQSGFTSETTPIGQLPPLAIDWMMAESGRQAARPGTIEEIDKAIDLAVGAELEATGKRFKMTKADMALTMRFEMIRAARELVRDTVREKKKARDTSDTGMLTLQAAQQRLAKLDALLKEAGKELTPKARAAVAD